MIAGPALALVGLATALSTFTAYHRIGITVSAVGLLLTAIAIGMSYPLVEFRTVLRKDARGAMYNQLRYLGHLKASAILLDLLWILGLVGLLIALLIRTVILNLEPSATLTTRVAALGAAAILVNLTHVHYLSLRIPMNRKERFSTTPFLFLALAVTALFALFAASNAPTRCSSFLQAQSSVPSISASRARRPTCSLF
jgi:glucan phosphoethanolaminetransferase (alkaline phosphatase superfamily)